MSETPIEWTHPRGYAGETLNPVVGCRPIGPGCLHCYAGQMAGQRLANIKTTSAKHAQRYHGITVEGEFRAKGRAEPITRHAFNGVINLDRDTALKPLRTKRPTTYFLCSMGDLFYGNTADRRAWSQAHGHESDFRAVPVEFLALVFAVAAECPQHRFLMLTKRPDRAAEIVGHPEFHRRVGSVLKCNFGAKFGGTLIDDVTYTGAWPIPNVAIGCSVSVQKDADESIPHLLNCPAAMRFVSYEPALEEIDFTPWMDPTGSACCGGDETCYGNGKCPITRWPRNKHGELVTIDWLICGGESHQAKGVARPFDLDWARSARRQCEAAGVAFFMKQLGSEPCNELVKCPHCGHIDDVEQFDALGADDGNCFCTQCGGLEFAIDENQHRFKSRKGGDPSEWPEDLRTGGREFPEAFFRQGGITTENAEGAEGGA